jgi:soluble cytochrome b562
MARRLGLDLSGQGFTVRRKLLTRAGLGAVLAGALLALLLAAGCGGGGGGGDGGGGDAADLEAMAEQIGALLDQIEALPTTATSAQDFSAKLAPIREQIQTLQEQAEQTEAPENLSSQRDQLANRLRTLRTQLGRVEGLLANGDLENAKTATEQLISVQQLRATIAAIEAASGGG